MLKIKLFFGSLIILISSVSAQKPQWLNYTSGYSVRSLASEGNDLWVTTSGGLMKLDKTAGSETFYNKANSGLTNNFVERIAIDKNGKKWITSWGGLNWNGGLTSFDGTTWKQYNLPELGIPASYITSIAIDSSGSIWLGTDNYCGLVKFDGTNWTVYKNSNSGLPGWDINTVTIDKKGFVWVGTDAGLAKFDGTNWTVYNTSNSGLPENNCNVLSISGNDSVWISTLTGLTLFDGTLWKTYTKSNSGLPSNYIQSVNDTRKGIIWIGTMEGLAKFDGTNWTTYTTQNSGLLNNSISSIVAEESGLVWVGSGFGGLVSFDGTNWLTHNTSNSGLPESSVYTIAADGNGSKWIGTWGGVASFNGLKWSTYTPSNSNLPYGGVRSIAFEKPNITWIPTESGLAKFDGVNFTVYNVANSGLPHDNVNAIAIDKNGTKWIGTQNGLTTFDGTYWKSVDGPDWSWPNNVTSIAIDTSGSVWIASFAYNYGFGLSVFDGSTWKTYTTSNSGLPDMDVYTVVIEPNGTKWIGTYAGGLVKFDGTSWKTYNTSNSGLPDNRVTSIAFGKDGSKWITTDKGGLAKFDGTNWQVFNAANSGLSYNGLTSVYVDDDGSKWIGGQGISVYNENGIPSADFSFETGRCNHTPVQFTEITQIDGVTIASWNWDFGDPASGSSDTSTLKNPMHVYLTPGNYTVNLVVKTTKGYSYPVSKIVSVMPELVSDFSYKVECQNNPVQFADLSQINGDGNVNYRNWIFGDPSSGTADTSSLPYPTHQYSIAGTYAVKLVCSLTGGCSDTIVKHVQVYEDLNINAGTDSIISSDSSIILHGFITGGSGNYTYHWEPAAMLVDANIQNPVTLPLKNSVIFACTVIDQTTFCKAEDQIQVNVIGGKLSVLISANSNMVCSGNTVQINTLVSGGTGNYSYSWTSNPPGFTSDLANPTDQPQLTTTYYVEIHDDSVAIVDSIKVQTGTCPGQPVISAGPDFVDLFVVTGSEYSTTGTSDATSYEWQVIPSIAGIITGTDLAALLSWNKCNITQVQINVRGINQYGHGPWSEDKITLINTTVRLNHIENDATEIFPNPGNGRFKIKTPKVISRIEIRDRLGKIVKLAYENNRNAEYNCDYLANGIYFLKIYTVENEIILRKLVITR